MVQSESYHDLQMSSNCVKLSANIELFALIIASIKKLILMLKLVKKYLRYYAKLFIQKSYGFRATAVNNFSIIFYEEVMHRLG
jgi:hypothetical protein